MPVYAHFETSLGNFTAELFESKTPKTVGVFAGLADGTLEWKHPKTGEKHKKPYYDGIIFHRIIDGFMIQGGDPLGLGYGGPGFQFPDEFHPELRHDRAGILSMANAGPNTNGSQFFVMHADYGLPPNYTIFGKLTGGEDVLDKIAGARTGAQDRPNAPVTINSVTIAEA
jgi:peptidyl-prolyl cis-trans isomerase A (cyclophilin A)